MPKSCSLLCRVKAKEGPELWGVRSTFKCSCKGAGDGFYRAGDAKIAGRMGPKES